MVVTNSVRPPIIRSISALRQQVDAWRMNGETIGLTPTMGALHAGHLSLIDTARKQGGATRIVASIFINPTQFGAGEDFECYPRNEGRDLEMFAAAGCDLVFAPSVNEMYPSGFATTVKVHGLTDILCGRSRPGHFDGVCLIVIKLLLQAQAHCAVFGEKDWQQLAVIRRLAYDLDIPTRILGAPIVRETDGLAMSSRNQYLTPDERAIAPDLFKKITQIAQSAAPDSIEYILAHRRTALVSRGFDRIDYLEARNADDLQPWTGDRIGRIFAAVFLGRARLIDNVAITSESHVILK